MTRLNQQEQGLDLYFKEIDGYPLLTRAEECQLARLIRKGDEAALQRLTRANLRFVVTVATHYQNQGLSLTDLISEGNCGLIRAAQKFDETKGVRFISYAVWWIRSSISRALADHSRTVRIPINRAAKIRQARKAQGRLAQQRGEEPTEEQVADVLEEDLQEVQDLFLLSQPPFSLDAPPPHYDDLPLSELLPGQGPSPDEEAERRMRDEIIKSLVSELSERETFIIENYFDLNREGPMTLEELGKELGITRERVRQIKERALQRLGHPSRRGKLAPYLTP